MLSHSPRNVEPEPGSNDNILLKSRWSPAENDFLPRPVQIFVNHCSFCYKRTEPLEGGASALVRKTQADYVYGARNFVSTFDVFDKRLALKSDRKPKLRTN
jgi:hypothetical protein